MSSRHKGQMDEKEKRLPPLNLTLKLIERLRNAKSKQTNCNVLAHNNNPPTPLSPMNTERDNSRCNFVILLNNVTRYPCQHIARFFFVVSTDIPPGVHANTYVHHGCVTSDFCKSVGETVIYENRYP